MRLLREQSDLAPYCLQSMSAVVNKVGKELDRQAWPGSTYHGSQSWTIFYTPRSNLRVSILCTYFKLILVKKVRLYSKNKVPRLSKPSVHVNNSELCGPDYLYLRYS